MRKQFLFVSLLAITGCGKISQQNSDTSALVNQQQANAAFQIVKGIDYLPFTYIVDGCYARSLYMSLELAAQGIPSSAHYVFGSLKPTTTVSWRYHVAPLLQLRGSTQEPWILDPAFEKEPLLRSQWIDKNFAQSSASLKTTAANTYTQIRAGSAYFDESGRTAKYDSPESLIFTAVKNSSGTITSLDLKPIDQSILIEDFENMPTFLSSDIHAACSVMYDYIGRETTITSAQKTAKINKLIASTKRLSAAMYENDKLEQDGTSGSNSTSTRACATAMAGYY